MDRETEEWQAATKYNFNKNIAKKKEEMKKEKRKKDSRDGMKISFLLVSFFVFAPFYFSRLLCRSFFLFSPASLLELHLMSSLCTLH